MLTAFMSPARCVEVSCCENASTAIRPSASYGNKVAAMPCILRRVFWRASNSSTVIPVLILGFHHGLDTARGNQMSAFLDLRQFFRQIRVLIVFVQRITTGGQSVPWRRGAIAEGSANTLALDLGALRCFPEELGIG